MDGLSGASNWRPHSDVMRSAKERVAGEPLPGVYHESGGWYTSNRGQLRMDGLQNVTTNWEYWENVWWSAVEVPTGLLTNRWVVS